MFQLKIVNLDFYSLKELSIKNLITSTASFMKELRVLSTKKGIELEFH